MRITDMRMLRWEKGNTILNNLKNVYLWKEPFMYPMTECPREQRYGLATHKGGIETIQFEQYYRRQNMERGLRQTKAETATP